MATVQTNHPLPAAPGQGQQYQQYQQYPQQPQQLSRHTRPRSKSGFSFRSHKSQESTGSAPKIDLRETSEEKQSQRLHTKADPLLAMSEAEPSAIATNTAQNLAPLRAIQHRDGNGQPIADPDRSNPTRSRWERPLDTIRSFEAAIDGNYSRKSYMRSESADSVTAHNRRSSYYAGSNAGTMTPRFPQEGYYGGRNTSMRPESYMSNNNGMQRDTYFEQNNNGPSNGYYPSRARHPINRNVTEPVYPPNANQQSYETVTTASGSGSSGEPLGYLTDPSSENSSLDRIQPAIPEHGDYYNSNSGYNTPGGYGGYQGHNGSPSPLSRMEQAKVPPRVPIKLGSAAPGAPTTYEAPRPGPGQKRKSWFGKRFSKS